MKKCSTCKETKPLSEFHKNAARKTGHEYNCKDCFRACSAAYYEKNKQKVKEYTLERKRNGYQQLREYKADCGCALCDEKEAICLDFHHIKSEEKEHSISNMVADGKSMSKIMKEIEKCVVVCSNCHKKIHAGILEL